MNKADLRKREIADGERLPRRKIDDAKRAAIVRAYQEGLSQKAVAQRYRVGQTSVQRILEEEGVPARPSHRPRRSTS